MRFFDARNIISSKVVFVNKNIQKILVIFLKFKFIELKTLGRCPNTQPVFEKTGQKLLSKRNYIAFFGNPFAMFLKPSLGEKAY